MQPPVAASAGRPVPRLADNPLILLEASNAGVLLQLAPALERDGCRVQVATTGAELLAAFRLAWARRQMPALVISDASDGLGALEAVRQSGWGVPFVQVVEGRDAGVGARAQRADAIVLRLPLDLADLGVIVRRLVRGAATGAAVACATCGRLDDPRPAGDGSDAFICCDCRALRDGG